MKHVLDGVLSCLCWLLPGAGRHQILDLSVREQLLAPPQAKVEITTDQGAFFGKTPDRLKLLFEPIAVCLFARLAPLVLNRYDVPIEILESVFA